MLIYIKKLKIYFNKTQHFGAVEIPWKCPCTELPWIFASTIINSNDNIAK